MILRTDVTSYSMGGATEVVVGREIDGGIASVIW